MPNKPSKSAAMRKIASDAVERYFPDRSPSEEDALVTSVVRQWITYDGHAYLMKEAECCYLVFQQTVDGYGLTVSQVAGDALHPFLRDWRIDPELSLEIMHSLNIRQSAEVTNLNGLALRFSVDPKERSIRIEDRGI